MRVILFCTCLIFGHNATSQRSIIALWNFNSTNDYSTIQTLPPGNGQGNLYWSLIKTPSQSSGTSNGGSGDTESPNHALGTSGYPKQGTENGKAGLLLNVDLSEFKYTELSFKMRCSNTASALYQISALNDRGDTVHKSLFKILTGEKWQEVIVDLSGIEEKIQIAISSIFDANVNKYIPVSNESSYSTAGTVRFDLIQLTGIPKRDLDPPILLDFEILSNRVVKFSFDEFLNPDISLKCINAEQPITINSTANILTVSFEKEFPQGYYWELCLSQVKDTLGNVMPDTCIEVFRNNSYPDLRISEIMYNPPGTDQAEFLELYNNGDDTIPLGDFYIKGIEHQFARHEFLPPGEYVVLTSNKETFSRTYGFNAGEWLAGSLLNSGECISIHNSSGGIVDQVCYDNNGEWPSAANGKGHSLELQQGFQQPLWWREAFNIIREDPTIFASPYSGMAKARVSFQKFDTSLFAENEIEKLPIIIKSQSAPVILQIEADSSSQGIDGIDFELEKNQEILPSNSPKNIRIKLLENPHRTEPCKIVLKVVGIHNGYLLGIEKMEVMVKTRFSNTTSIQERSLNTSDCQKLYTETLEEISKEDPAQIYHLDGKKIEINTIRELQYLPSGYYLFLFKTGKFCKIFKP